MKQKSAAAKVKSVTYNKTDESPTEERVSNGKVIKMDPKSEIYDITEDDKTQAAKAEQAKSYEEAEKLYKKIISQNQYDVFAYNRLMIVYRKQKKYNEELKLINKSVKILSDHYVKRINKKKTNAQVKQLSTSLMKKLGLTDKKGNALYEPEPIAGWKKRKLTVEKRIG